MRYAGTKSPRCLDSQSLLAPLAHERDRTPAPRRSKVSHAVRKPPALLAFSRLLYVRVPSLAISCAGILHKGGCPTATYSQNSPASSAKPEATGIRTSRSIVAD